MAVCGNMNTQSSLVVVLAMLHGGVSLWQFLEIVCQGVSLEQSFSASVEASAYICVLE